MKTSVKWLLAAGVITAVTVLALYRSAQVISVAALVPLVTEALPPAAVMPAVVASADSGPEAAVVQTSDAAGPSTITEWIPQLDPAAVASMREARLHGDSRTPALSPTIQRVMPGTAELQDYDLYLAYEQRQEQRMYRAFVDASGEKIALIQANIEQAKKGGISDEQIAFAQQKMAKIQALADKLKQEHPEIMGDDFQPEPDWLSQ